MTFTKHQAELVQSFAVRYSAYVEAQAKRDDAGAKIWGRLLRELQDTHGVQLVPSEYLPEERQ